MGDYKIYKYTNKINNKVYIGQTRQSIEERAQGKGWGYKKCPRFFSAIKHYGWENFTVEILHEGLEREEADALEKSYISYYRDKLNLSYNIEDGGKSKGEHRNSDEVKHLISESMKGKNAGTKNGMYGRSGELSLNSIPVYEFDNITMIKKYSCVRECSKVLGIESSLLSSYLNKSVLKVNDKYYSKSMSITNNDINNAKIYTKLNVGVSQYDFNGNLIKHYKCTNHVNKTGLVSDSTLRDHRDKPWKYNGYIWVFDDIICSKDDIINASETIIISKPKESNSILKTTMVNKYDMMGKFIISYPSFAEAINNDIVLQNDLKYLHKGAWPSKGYIWVGDNNNLEGFDLVLEAFTNVYRQTLKIPYFEFDLNGRFIKAYHSQNDMKKHNGLSRDTIMKYMNDGPFIYKDTIITDLNHLYPIDNIKDRVKHNIISKPKRNK